MAENLIESIKSFKASMTFKNLDFDANKAAQSSAVHETMAAFIVMMKLYLAQLRPRIGLPENFGQLSQEDQVTVKKRDQNTKRIDCETKE